LPYRYLENIAAADIAFEATGKDMEELLRSAWDATLHIMISDAESIRGKHRLTVRICKHAADLLLYELLEELIFHKDAESMLLRIEGMQLEQSGDSYQLEAELAGEKIDPSRHELLVDVKAVTFHRFTVDRSSRGWYAMVVLDV
jgi:SHS2 domain-containing protein